MSVRSLVVIGLTLICCLSAAVGLNEISAMMAVGVLVALLCKDWLP